MPENSSAFHNRLKRSRTLNLILASLCLPVTSPATSLPPFHHLPPLSLKSLQRTLLDLSPSPTSPCNPHAFFIFLPRHPFLPIKSLLFFASVIFFSPVSKSLSFKAPPPTHTPFLLVFINFPLSDNPPQIQKATAEARATPFFFFFSWPPPPIFVSAGGPGGRVRPAPRGAAGAPAEGTAVAGGRTLPVCQRGGRGAASAAHCLAALSQRAPARPVQGGCSWRGGWGFIFLRFRLFFVTAGLLFFIWGRWNDGQLEP